MMKRLLISLFIGMGMVLNPSLSRAAGEAAALSLLDLGGSRPNALGTAASALQDDITGANFNPASLNTLQSGQAAFNYRQGLEDDSFGQFQIGVPSRKGAWGLNVGYYDGGSFELFDGTTQRTVKAQQDMIVSLAYAFSAGPVSIGMAGKYISSELVETEKATAYAGDLGIQLQASRRLNLGAAAQNFGTQLKFVEEGDDLPRVVRGGASFLLLSNSYAPTLFLDVPYYLNGQSLEPAMGLETHVGPLALRGGVRRLEETTEFTAGTGFFFGGSSLDYSFGLINDLESRHQVSYSLKFGGPAVDTRPQLVKKIKRVKQKQLALPVKREVQEQQVVRKTLGGNEKVRWLESPRRTVYTVKPGDTLRSIAKHYYGNGDLWKEIYAANKHLINDPSNIKKGEAIVLP